MEVRPLDDAELADRARRGDEEAYAELVQRHADLAFRTAWAICGSAAEAEEAAQDGFLAAYRALPRFRPGAPVRPWLLRIVANAARNRRRSAGRRDQAGLRLADSLRTADAVPSPERMAEAAEERAALLRAIATLDVGGRDVVSCRYFLQLSVAETAAVLGCREGTVKSRLARSLARLRAALEAEGAIVSEEGAP
ncbi:MAG TPA: RNA polymerase sigma factor [Candidatus Dormibacteraeota bacterium]|nr:RNA polymerase sigma factor [Candidatus Dormibacteraeota bacterium]